LGCTAIGEGDEVLTVANEIQKLVCDIKGRAWANGENYTMKSFMVLIPILT
jgi:hypothetical protein